MTTGGPENVLSTGARTEHPISPELPLFQFIARLEQEQSKIDEEVLKIYPPQLEYQHDIHRILSFKHETRIFRRQVNSDEGVDQKRITIMSALPSLYPNGNPSNQYSTKKYYAYLDYNSDRPESGFACIVEGVDSKTDDGGKKTLIDKYRIIVATAILNPGSFEASTVQFLSDKSPDVLNLFVDAFKNSIKTAKEKIPKEADRLENEETQRRERDRFFESGEIQAGLSKALDIFDEPTEVPTENPTQLPTTIPETTTTTEAPVS